MMWRRSHEPGGEAIILEGDSRHVRELRAELDLLNSARSVSSPGLKVVITEESEKPLDDERRTTFRSACMRLSYAAIDRPELQYCAKEASRGMASPLERHWTILKRAVRFCIAAERCGWTMSRQRRQKFLEGYTDTDWAGCPTTRRSTTGMAFMAGSHLLLTASSTHVPISMSSGESEFYGLVRTASILIGMGGFVR